LRAARFPIAGLMAAVLVVALALAALGNASEAWACAMLLVTCAVLTLGVIGLVCSGEAKRTWWLGYWAWFVRALGRPSARWGFVAAADARTVDALEVPIPMRFPEETPLEEVLQYVLTATRGRDGKGIPVYYEAPRGEVDRSLSGVHIDMEGVPLRTTLQLCLAQLGLAYSIRGGSLVITSEEGAFTPVYQDPFLIVGHCLLALVAAAVGAIAGLQVFDRRKRAEQQPADGGSTRSSC
jgi:hypothetical protein